MNFGSVCSGIESASVAWNPLGWRASFVAEIEPFPCHVLAERHGAGRPMFMPDPAKTKKLKDRRARAAAIKALANVDAQGAVPNFGDLNQFEEWPDADIDVLVGGTPCQDFSVAGLRKGLDGVRGNLTLVYAAIARRYRPRWMVWENVPGVLSNNRGQDFASLLGLLAGARVEVPPCGWQTSGVVQGIDRAYGLAWRVLDAQFVRVDGFGRAVPQRRRRVFVVGYLGDWRRAAAVLFERASLSGHPAPRRQAREGVAPTLSARTEGGGGLGTDFDCDGGLIASPLTAGMAASAARMPHEQGALVAFGGNNRSGPIDVATAQTAHGGTGRSDFESETFLVAPSDAHEASGAVAHALRADGFDASEDGTGRGTPLVPICFDETQITSTTCRSNPRPGEPCHTLSSQARPPTLAFSTKDYGNDCCEDFAPTMRAMGHSDSHGNAGGQLGVVSNWRVRRLMPVECERLQGFPDGYTLVRYPLPKWAARWPERVKFAADGPRYKALGNSKAVNCVRWIGRRIQMVEDICARIAA